MMSGWNVDKIVEGLKLIRDRTDSPGEKDVCNDAITLLVCYCRACDM